MEMLLFVSLIVILATLLFTGVFVMIGFALEGGDE